MTHGPMSACLNACNNRHALCIHVCSSIHISLSFEMGHPFFDGFYKGPRGAQQNIIYVNTCYIPIYIYIYMYVCDSGVFSNLDPFGFVVKRKPKKQSHFQGALVLNISRHCPGGGSKLSVAKSRESFTRRKGLTAFQNARRLPYDQISTRFPFLDPPKVVAWRKLQPLEGKSSDSCTNLGVPAWLVACRFCFRSSENPNFGAPFRVCG